MKKWGGEGSLKLRSPLRLKFGLWGSFWKTGAVSPPQGGKIAWRADFERAEAVLVPRGFGTPAAQRRGGKPACLCEMT